MPSFFFCQPTFNKVKVKRRLGHWICYWLEIKSGVYFKLAPVYNAFLHDLKLSGYRIRIQFNKSIIVVEENNYPTKFVNAYIVYDLDDWQ